MMEVRTKVQPVKVEIRCDHCGCELKRTKSLTVHPVRYRYECEGCRFTYESTKAYPCIEYETIDMDPERKYLPHISDK